MNNITSFDFGAGNFKRYSADGGIVIPSQVAAAIYADRGKHAGGRRGEHRGAARGGG